jgi:hypothetical protein
MSNIGKVITDFYCNGYAGRRYDLEGAIIEAEGKGYIILRLKNGEPEFVDFRIFVRGEFKNFMGETQIQQLIDAWTA